MSSVPSLALVGRASELRTVIDVIARPPAVVQVEGEAGIGKTRLVRAALGHVPGDRVVLLGYCHQIREPFPYGPVFEALRDIAGRLPDPGALNPVTGALAGYLPELAGALPPAPPPLGDPRAERHRVFRAIRALLAAVGPAVLVIEDLHWADDGTRDLLRFLIDQPPAGLALVITYRREDHGATRASLGRAYRHHPETTSVVVPLVPLDVTDVGDLAGALLNRSDLSSGFVTRLHERTAGIPFVVEEVVRSLRDPGEPEALDRAGVPLLLREAMAERMASLSAAAVRTVHVAAVLRLPAGEQLIIAAGGDSAGLGEALRAGVLHEDSRGRYGFRHALAQQAVYDAIPGPERRSAHERVMGALAAMDSPPLVQLAFHARQAGDIESWLRHGAAAAHRAAALGDMALAIEVFEGMLDDPDLPESERGPLALQLSKFAGSGLSHQRVVRLLRHVLRDDFLSPDARAEARLHLGLLLSNQAGDTVGGRPEIKAAVEELTDQPTLAARGLACLAMPPWGTETLDQHAEWMDRAEKLVASADNPEVATAVLANRASFQMAIGAPDAFAVAATLPIADTRMSVRREAARGYANLYDSLITLGLYPEAEKIAREGRRLAAETGADYSAYIVDVSAIRMEWLTGRWAGLRERAIAMSELVADTPQIAVDVWLVLGMLALATGEWDGAARHFHAAGLDAPDSRYAPVVDAAGGGMIELHLARGALDEAVAEAERAVARLRRKGVWVWGAYLVPSAVNALAWAGRTEQAAGLVAEYAAGVADKISPAAHAALDSARGALAAAERRHADAAAHFARAREAYAVMPQPYAAARAGEGEARAMLAVGDPATGAAFAELAERYGEFGATHDAARCRRVLRDIGVEFQLPRGRRGKAAAPSPRGKATALSQRETEVARLVALGRTNKEIADVLFLSTRTVESHVATVLRKLGVRSRTQVAPPA
ncbi:AAA family ATPase [Sphaerisporangium sp. NPDC051017]|uniref:helix-turn-helix transcriptional regulator n=1 Tax=Sphaerisporangium sp. NPDC051017 TaxID=3154636 RepID=UPI003436C4F9